MPKPERKTHPLAAAAMGSLWAVSAAAHSRVQQLLAQVASVNWNEPADDTRLDQRETKVVNGVAVIPVIGLIVKYAGFYDRYWGCVATEWITAELDRVELDPFVKRIVLLFDSPGGMVDGSTQLASRVDRCKKPIDAVVSDDCCSAAFYVACRCASITANETAHIGSIGVYVVGMKDKAFWAEMGIEWETISSGGIKGLGQDGDIPQALKDEWQRGVDDTFNSFCTAVADGRGITIEEARRLGDGRTYRAAESVSLKLIDRVVDAAVAIDTITQEVITMTQQEFQQHATANPDWVKTFAEQGYNKAKAELTLPPATASELKQAFNATEDREFLVARMDVSASMAEHKAAYADHMKARNAALTAELSTLKQEIGRLDPARAGTSRIGTPPAGTGDGESPLVSDAMNRAKK